MLTDKILVGWSWFCTVTDYSMIQRAWLDEAKIQCTWVVCRHELFLYVVQAGLLLCLFIWIVWRLFSVPDKIGLSQNHSLQMKPNHT